MIVEDETMSDIEQQVTADEPDEGIEDAAHDAAPYEAVQRRVLIQQYDYAVRTLMDMVIEGDLILDPDYQRNYRWADTKASRFIESIALNIPVPVFYFAEESDGRFSVIDGQQRLTSLFRYMKSSELNDLFPGRDLTELTLAGLQVRADLNGKKFTSLPREDRSLISKRPMRCIVVLNESDETLKFEVFERLNSGSASLTDQEIRNCIYRGSFNRLIKELAKNQRFQEMISLPEMAQRNMKDAELVLRFFAYRDLSADTQYSDNYTEYLNTYMEENREISGQKYDELRSLFEETIDIVFETLGPGVAFRKPLNLNSPQTSGFAANLINGSIYESQMIAFSRVVESGSDGRDLRTAALQAFGLRRYTDSIFSGTSQRSRAMTRSLELSKLLMD